MALLKDNEREQLRQLVKACLLEISKLKIELKKCQNEPRNSNKLETKIVNEKNQEIKILKKELKEKDKKTKELMELLHEKNDEIDELRKIKQHFEALTARPKRDLTSFQSQVYRLLDMNKGTIEELYTQITAIGFRELSFDNFNNILRNLERKGYFKSSEEDGIIIWKKLEK